MRRIPKPTDSELSILRILWDEGPSEVRVVADKLSEGKEKPVGYTTALKLLQLMHEKGLVDRDESRRSHRYSAKHEPSEIQRNVLRSIADRAFGGDLFEMAMHAVSSTPASPKELAEIEALLNKLKKK